MLHLEAHGDVTRLAFTSVTSRLMGFGVSAYAVRGALVDCAFPGVREDLLGWVAAHQPAGVILTHWHEDHAGNASSLAALGVPMQMLESTESRVRAFGHIGWYRRLCWGVPSDLSVAVRPFSHPALDLLPATGHSDDHHVVWDAERETMFGGDLFIGVKVRIAHLDEDPRTQVDSLRRVVALRPRRFFDGHRGLLPDAVVQLTAKADWIEAMIGAIEEGARRGWPVKVIRNEVLGREDRMGIVSRGHYSRLNFVRNVLASGRLANEPASSTTSPDGEYSQS